MHGSGVCHQFLGNAARVGLGAFCLECEHAHNVVGEPDSVRTTERSPAAFLWPGGSHAISRFEEVVLLVYMDRRQERDITEYVAFSDTC